jgi:hypothetical protein
MKEQSVVHIKIDYEEAVRSKKNILSSEADFLRIIKRIKRYEILRSEELNNRIRIQNKIRDLKTDITKINEVFPKVKLPDILKKKEAPKKIVNIEQEKELKVEIEKQHEDNDLENQLREIQEKLKRLG